MGRNKISPISFFESEFSHWNERKKWEDLNPTENTEREKKKRSKGMVGHTEEDTMRTKIHREFKYNGLGKKHTRQKLTQRKLAHQCSYCSKYMILRNAFVGIYFTLIKNTFTLVKDINNKGDMKSQNYINLNS